MDLAATDQPRQSGREVCRDVAWTSPDGAAKLASGSSVLRGASGIWLADYLALAIHSSRQVSVVGKRES